MNYRNSARSVTLLLPLLCCACAGEPLCPPQAPKVAPPPDLMVPAPPPGSFRKKLDSTLEPYTTRPTGPTN